MKAKLILVAGKADKGEVRLKLPTIIGRTREAGLMIAHKTVSRRHCELFERHGMLYVRDSGSLNGTLVDDAPIKESMLKPGHTVTVGPLTFRAEYEPADAFLGGDDPNDAINGVADTATGMTNAGLTGAGESNRTAAMPTFNGQFDDANHAVDSGATAGTENGAAEEVLDFGADEPADESALDFGADETLSMEISEETTDLKSLESPAGMPELESAEFDASEFTPTDPSVAESVGPATVEEDADVAFSLDEVDSESTEEVHVESSDDLALDFSEETEPPQAAAVSPVVEPAAAESSDFDLDVGDELGLEPAAGPAADVEDLLPAGGEADDASFDFLADDAPAAAAESTATESGADDEFSLAGDDGAMDFGLPEPAAAGNASADDAFNLGEDDGGTFDLADDSSSTAAAEPAAESEALDFGSDEEVTFDLADSAEEPEPAKDEAKGAAKKKPTDEDDEMSDFLKELGM